MRSPSAIALSSCFNTTKPEPSPRTYPFACPSKARHCPVGEMAPALDREMLMGGEINAFTPPANAIVASPQSILRQARCTHTRDEEHAVSTARLGPRRSKKRSEERRV